MWIRIANCKVVKLELRYYSEENLKYWKLKSVITTLLCEGAQFLGLGLPIVYHAFTSISSFSSEKFWYWKWTSEIDAPHYLGLIFVCLHSQRPYELRTYYMI